MFWKRSFWTLRNQICVALHAPRWKYFSAMMFLDRLSSSSSLYSEANTSVYDEINDAAFVCQESFLGKRTAGNLTIVSGRNTVDGRYRTRKGIISTSNTVDGESVESTVLATKDVLVDLSTT
uniref:Bm7262 n=2 Tax=Brugia malayi TaxID=6279 RepID=A0A0I9R3E6_BRUMA|nr:Bm7262 [Brugia malayi]